MEKTKNLLERIGNKIGDKIEALSNKVANDNNPMHLVLYVFVALILSTIVTLIFE